MSPSAAQISTIPAHHQSSPIPNDTSISTTPWILKGATVVRPLGLKLNCDNSLTSAVYVKGRHLGYQRGKRNTNPNVSLLALEGVGSTEAARYAHIFRGIVYGD